MKVVWMSKTIEWIVNSNQTKESVEWATNLIQSGEVKNTQTGIRYVLIEQI